MSDLLVAYGIPRAPARNICEDDATTTSMLYNNKSGAQYILQKCSNVTLKKPVHRGWRYETQGWL